MSVVSIAEFTRKSILTSRFTSSTQHGGRDEVDNLALSCHLCNSKKGPNLSSLDPETGLLTRLFHPRTDRWSEHFRATENGHIIGITDVGRTTVHLLEMNSEIRTRIRREIRRLGEE